jgi:hypothetical protein
MQIRSLVNCITSTFQILVTVFIGVLIRNFRLCSMSWVNPSIAAQSSVLEWPYP